MAEGRRIPDIMVSNLVPSGLDPGQYIGMAQDSFSNQKESGFDILPFEDLQHLRREGGVRAVIERESQDRKSTRLNSSHSQISYAVFCLKKKKLATKLRNRPLVL